MCCLTGASPWGHRRIAPRAPGADRDHRVRAGDARGRDHGPGRDAPGGPIAQVGHRTAVRHDRRALLGDRRWQAGCWLVGQRRGRSGRVRQRAGDRPRDQKTPATPRVARNAVLVAVLAAPRWVVPLSARCARRARVEGREEQKARMPRWVGRRPAVPRLRRPLPAGGEADRVADAEPRWLRHPPVRVTRRPSAERTMAHRNTDCRHRRHRGTAQHSCGCGESGVCFRSFENCKWYGGLPSDLEWSATPRLA